MFPLFFAAAATAFSQETPTVVERTLAVPATPADPGGPRVIIREVQADSVPSSSFAVPAIPRSSGDVLVPTPSATRVGEPVTWTYQDSSNVFPGFRLARSRSGPVTYLGVSAVSPGPELSAHLAIPADTGLVVETVVSGSPAEKAGIRQNDVLARLDDQILIHPQQLAVLVANHKEGDRVKLVVIRKAGEIEASAELGKQDAGSGDVELAAAARELGIVIDGKLERPLRTFTRRFSLGDGPDGRELPPEAAEAMKAAEGTLKHLRSGALQIAPLTDPADDDTVEAKKSTREELGEIRRMLDELTKKLDQEK